MAGKLEKIHAKAIKRFEDIYTRERDERREAIEDIRFTHVLGGQWSEEMNEKRKDQPRFTVNRVLAAVMQVTGDQRENRTSIKVIPTAEGTKEIAEVFTGLVRSIEARSDAESIYDGAFDESVCGGYGGWRVITEYVDDGFDQEIKLLPIRSAASSLWFDPASVQYDKSDAKYAFYTTYIPEEEFKDRFPKASVQDFDGQKLDTSADLQWYDGENIQIAEYWEKEPITKQIALLSDGRIIDSKEEKDVLDELIEMGITVKRTRSVESHKVVRYLMSGAEILEGPENHAGKHIPLVPVYGRTIEIEGKKYVSGLVRHAKDPQRILNYAESASVEASAMAPKDPIWITAEQARGHESSLKNFNRTNSPFMLYNSDPKAPGAPQRGGAPQVQQALILQAERAENGVFATTGIQPPSLGINPELQSGKAVIAQQKMGDRGSFIYSDNLTKSIRYTGEILADLMPKIYDTERVITILNIDGSTEDIEINKAISEFNQPVIDQQTGKQIIVNDLTQGKYDVYISSGAAYSTKRQESAQQLIDLSTNNQAFAEFTPDLIAKSLDTLDADELHKRLRKVMIQKGIAEPTEEEIKEFGLDKEQPPDPLQQAMLQNAQADTEKKQAEIRRMRSQALNLDADTASKALEANKVVVTTLKTLLEGFKSQSESGIPFTPQNVNALIEQLDIVQESQMVIDPGPNSSERHDLVRRM